MRSGHAHTHTCTNTDTDTDTDTHWEHPLCAQKRTNQVLGFGAWGLGVRGHLLSFEPGFEGYRGQLELKLCAQGLQ